MKLLPYRFGVVLFTLMCVACSQIQFDVSTEEEPIDMSMAGQYKNISDSSLLWGPYRSGLYFGIRPRIPRSLLSGLMWFNVDDYNGIGKIRHFYEQNEPMKRANWVHYDPRFGGRQVIVDKECHIKLIFDFVKSEDGLSWTVRVKTKPQKGFDHVKTAFIWYSALESEVVEHDVYGQEKVSGTISLDMDVSLDGAYEGAVKLKGVSEDLGFFSMIIGNGPNTNKHPKAAVKERELDPSLSHHLSLRVPNDKAWQAKDFFITLLQDSIKELMDKYEADIMPPQQTYILRDQNKFEGNFHFVQQIYEGASQFDVVFDNAFTPQNQKINSDNFDEKFAKVLSSFDSKFDSSFELAPPFDTPEYQPFAKEILSGLLGGLSYFYGDHLVDRDTVFEDETFESFDLKGELEGPHKLFTLVPSRPFFPRGFLWDEGFHLLPLLDYDSDLILEVVQSWFDLIDEDGWIAREQILGPESRSRVPEQFQHQSPEIVNPPTLMLVFTYLLENIKAPEDLEAPKRVDDYGAYLDRSKLGDMVLSNPEVLVNYTKQIYPKLKSHYEMFRRSQKGFLGEFERPLDLEAYRWRGRTLTHCLASGLDDYPRALPVDITELNVDLLSWIGVMTRSIKLVAQTLGEEEDVKTYQTIEDKIIEDLNGVHWSEKDGVYCDASVDEDDESFHACFKGYISLFPMLTKLMKPDDFEKIEKLVDLISDPEELWSDFGIRSLSKSDENYRTAENYWRSPIWVQMNYLVLDSLKYYKEAGPEMSSQLSQKLSTVYHDLRLNVVNNVYKQWKKTGFVWEQYDDETGEAKGAKNFLGWTSSVILMMKMPESI